MKKLLLPLFGALLLASSCSEDFEVAAPYKEVTVVYGLLDIRNPAQYIRVQKAFMDEQNSALVLARQADSSFYQNLRVEMREISGNTVTTFPALQRVDLQAEGFPKDTGVFFNTPSFAYKTTQTLSPGRRYRLIITNTATRRVDSAETEVIDPSTSALAVVELEPTPLRPINFSNSAVRYSLSLNPFPPQAKMIEAVMRFHIIERNTSTGSETEKTYDFTFATLDSTSSDFGANPNQSGSAQPRISAANSTFFNFLASALGPAPAGIERRLDSPDVLIHVGTREMLRYQIFNGASGGITGDQVRPLYTNIRSADGNALGLFAARTTHAVLEVPIDRIVVDSLRNNPQTSNLNIVGLSAR